MILPFPEIRRIPHAGSQREFRALTAPHRLGSDLVETPKNVTDILYKMPKLAQLFFVSSLRGFHCSASTFESQDCYARGFAFETYDENAARPPPTNALETSRIVHHGVQC
jgi:hypothetical protein